jgi:hypothetical protein
MLARIAAMRHWKAEEYYYSDNSGVPPLSSFAGSSPNFSANWVGLK